MGSDARASRKRLIASAAAVVALVGIAAAVIVGIEWWQARSSLAGPASLRAVSRVVLADGRHALLVTTHVSVETGDDTSGSRHVQYGHLVIEAATGRVVAQRWWDERHDQPQCRAAQSGVISCSSPRLATHARQLATLERTDASDIAEAPPAAPPSRCVDHIATLDDFRFSLRRIETTRRKRVEVQRGDGEPRGCEAETLEGGFLCDADRGTALAVPGAGPRVIVTDLGSIIPARQTLSLLAIDADCRVAWRVAQAPGRVLFSTATDELVILGIDRGRPSRDAPSLLLALHGRTGQIVWRLTL